MITVDWEDGADELNYLKSVQNIRVVGRQVGAAVQRLHRRAGLALAAVHLIGHSLGAHAAGYAGKHVQGIGRITGELILPPPRQCTRRSVVAEFEELKGCKYSVWCVFE